MYVFISILIYFCEDMSTREYDHCFPLPCHLVALLITYKFWSHLQTPTQVCSQALYGEISVGSSESCLEDAFIGV